MKIKIFLLALLLPFFKAHGQTKPLKYHDLSIGDIVPNIEIKHLINYPTSTAHISDFRGKLLILDFWATWCSPCVAAFPKMEELRKVFKDKIVILPVTDQTEETVGSLLTNMQNVKGISGYSIIRDTVLTQLFKHTYIPHYVWINEIGKVIAITDGDEVTQNNILKLLDHERLDLKMKANVKKLYDTKAPLIAGSNDIPIDSIIQLHVLTKYIDGFPQGADVHLTIDHGLKITALNYGVAQLFNFAYSKFNPALLGSKNTIVKVADSIKIAGPDEFGKGPGKGRDAYKAWWKKSSYCYELIVGHDHLKDAWTIFQEDLKKAFPEYTVAIEKRKGKCLVIVCDDNKCKIATKGGNAEKSDNKYSFHLKNAPWQTLPLRLKTYYLQLSNLPILDETGIKGNVDIDIVADMSSVTELRMALKKYGLSIIEADRDIDVIVIKDQQPEKSTQIK